MKASDAASQLKPQQLLQLSAKLVSELSVNKVVRTHTSVTKTTGRGQICAVSYFSQFQRNSSEN